MYNLQKILNNHSEFVVCYAMKEEMIDLFQLSDFTEARKVLRNWFVAAKGSRIPAMVLFAELKEK